MNTENTNQETIEHHKPESESNLAIILEVQRKLFEIENKLNDIYDAVHPPLWKSIPKWIIRHIIPISLFVVSVYGLYQGYLLFADLREQLLPLLEAKEDLGNIDESLIETLTNLELPF